MSQIVFFLFVIIRLVLMNNFVQRYGKIFKMDLQIVLFDLQMMIRQSFLAFQSLGVMPVMALNARKKEDSVVKPDCIHTSATFISGC